MLERNRRPLAIALPRTQPFTQQSAAGSGLSNLPQCSCPYDTRIRRRFRRSQKTNEPKSLEECPLFDHAVLLHNDIDRLCFVIFPFDNWHTGRRATFSTERRNRSGYPWHMHEAFAQSAAITGVGETVDTAELSRAIMAASLRSGPSTDRKWIVEGCSS